MTRVVNQLQDRRTISSSDFPINGPELERARAYLTAVATAALGGPLRAKLSPSDLVQQTYLDAIQDSDRFRGSSKPELWAWLRRILLNNVTNVHRTYRAQKRDLQRERANIDLTRIQSTKENPVATVTTNEEVELLAKALDAILNDYQRVILLRNFEQHSWIHIGQEFDRSAEAARNLWLRALRALRSELGLNRVFPTDD